MRVEERGRRVAYTSVRAPNMPAAAILTAPPISSARPAIMTSLESVTPARLAVTANGTVMPSEVPRMALYSISLEGFHFLIRPARLSWRFGTLSWLEESGDGGNGFSFPFSVRHDCDSRSEF